jgi:DNA-binding LacI/PurR family transcriptional regulator
VTRRELDVRAKYTDIVKALEARLSGGDYALSTLPSERRIAEEFGVSHMTARRAVQHLVDRGVLSRVDGRSRATADPGRAAKQVRICCVFPAFESRYAQEAYRTLSGIVAARRGLTRAVMYVHEEDPVIQQAIMGDFTGLFMVPPHRPSQLLLDHMSRNRQKLVTLWTNYTDLGIPCVEGGPTSGVNKLVRHLADLGHRHVDCLNTQPDDNVVRARIAAWREALQQFGLQGDLYDLPVEPFGETGLAARDHTRRLIETRRLRSTAMFCVTTGAAIGVCRALYELKIEVGTHYSVCGFGEMMSARLHTPSLTVTEPADMVPYLKMGLDWILSGGKTESPSLIFQPSEARVWIGESTGPMNTPGL